MTLNEQERYAAQFMKRCTSRIVAVQSGLQERFGQDAYVHDTQEDTVNSGAPTDTTKVDPSDQGNDGSAAREGSDEAWQTDVANALKHVYRAMQNVGANRSVDDGTLAGLNILASTMQALRQLPSGVSIAKAVANADGVTREPLVVNDNAVNSHAGSRNAFIPTSELARMESEAGSLTKMTSRVVSVTAL